MRVERKAEEIVERGVLLLKVAFRVRVRCGGGMCVRV